MAEAPASAAVSIRPPKAGRASRSSSGAGSSSSRSASSLSSEALSCSPDWAQSSPMEDIGSRLGGARDGRRGRAHGGAGEPPWERRSTGSVGDAVNERTNVPYGNEPTKVPSQSVEAAVVEAVRAVERAMACGELEPDPSLRAYAVGAVLNACTKSAVVGNGAWKRALESFERIAIPLLDNVEERDCCSQGLCNGTVQAQCEYGAGAAPCNATLLLDRAVGNVVRLAYQCPLKDVSASAMNFATRIQEYEMGRRWTARAVRGPSSFVPASECIALVGTPAVHGVACNESAQELMKRLFNENGCITNLEQVLAWHPSYLQRRAEERAQMMYHGPLHPHWRYAVLAMLLTKHQAAASHDCTYLAKVADAHFEAHPEVRDWAKGHSQFPLKLQKLLPINALLAHTPWLLRPEHIGELLHGEDSWTLGELVHAVVIICTAHAECSAVYGMGLNADLNDLSGVHDAEVVGLVGIAEGVDPGEDHTAELASELQRAELTGSDDAAVFDKERQAREFEQAGKDDIAPDGQGHSNRLDRYVGPHKFQPTDFMLHCTEYSVLRVQDFSWRQHGYALVSQAYPDIAPQIDDLFDHTYELTYKTFSTKENINTEPFRMAIWHYVHRVKGILHDDYDYHQVNIWLRKPLKAFVKKIVVLPEVVAKKDFENLGVNLTPSEKCHVVLLALQARKQAELVYGLHALMRYRISNLGT